LQLGTVLPYMKYRSCLITASCWPFSVCAQLSATFDTSLLPFANTGWDANWYVRSGSTLSSNTGPSGAFEGSSYVYTESSNFFNKNCVLEATSAGGVGTVSFAYSMYGETMGTLAFQTAPSGSTTWTTHWTKSSNQGNGWKLAHFSVVDTTAVKVRFSGTTGTSHTSDMAIDAVTITAAGTPSFSPVPAPTTSFSTSPAPIPAPSAGAIPVGAITATFETDFSPFFQPLRTWRRASGSTPSSSTGPSSARGGSYYAFTEATDQFLEQFILQAASPTGVETVEFYYNMYGDSMGTLAFETSTSGSTK
jgi:hypothetical protein